MLPEWTELTKLPKSCHWITNAEGKYLYRKLVFDDGSTMEQVITFDHDRTHTLYNGHWPDHSGIRTLDDAKIVADTKAEFLFSFEPCDN